LAQGEPAGHERPSALCDVRRSRARFLVTRAFSHCQTRSQVQRARSASRAPSPASSLSQLGSYQTVGSVSSRRRLLRPRTGTTRMHRAVRSRTTPSSAVRLAEHRVAIEALAARPGLYCS
jgi:hypothetical protein